MFKNQLVKSIFLLLFIVSLNSVSLAQTSKSDTDVNESVIVLEINNKKYGITNVSYSSSFIAPSPETPQVANEITYYMSFSILNQFMNQEIMDWAMKTPFKNESGTIKIYNATKTKVLRELKFENSSISSFSNSEDMSQTSNGTYATASFSLNCKNLSLRIINK